MLAAILLVLHADENRSLECSLSLPLTWLTFPYYPPKRAPGYNPPLASTPFSCKGHQPVLFNSLQTCSAPVLLSVLFFSSAAHFDLKPGAEKEKEAQKEAYMRVGKKIAPVTPLGHLVSALADQWPARLAVGQSAHLPLIDYSPSYCEGHAAEEPRENHASCWWYRGPSLHNNPHVCLCSC